MYRARDNDTSRIVAAKLISVPDDWGRIQREVTALRQIVHPGVVRLLDFGMDEEYAVLVMEYIEGVTLATLLSRGGIIPWRRALRMVLRTLEGLDRLHSAGLIHRDIKPSNLMVVNSDPPVLKILDLGVVKLMGTSRPITQAGEVLGTPHYMPPEQRTGLRITPAVDIYALGVVLWQMLTGGTPDTSGLFNPRWPDPAGDPPAQIRHLVERMVHPSRLARYSTAEPCLADVCSLLEHGRLCGKSATIKLKAVS